MRRKMRRNAPHQLGTLTILDIHSSISINSLTASRWSKKTCKYYFFVDVELMSQGTLVQSRYAPRPTYR